MSFDHYATLEICQTATEEAIKTSYRRLAKLHHPDRNRSDPGATARFQSIQAAYSTLCDPTKRREYDLKGVFHPTPRPAGTKNAPHRNAPSTDNAGDEDAALEREIAEILKTMENLRAKRNQLSALLSATTRERAASQSVLERLNKEAAKDEAQKNTWYNYLFGRTVEAKEAMERRAVDRRASQRLREYEVKLAEVVMERTRADIDDLERRLLALSNALATKQTQLNVTRSAAEKTRQDAWKARQYREAQEKAEKERRAATREYEDMMTKIREEQQATAQAARARPKKQQERKQKQPQSCPHNMWWNKELGRGTCERCERTFGFLLRCPGCRMATCAACCKHLKMYQY